MSAEPEPQRADPVWRLAAGIAIMIIAAALFGFVVVPLAQPDVATIGPLTAICRAIGLRPVAFNRHDSNAEGSRKARWLVSKDGRQMIVQVCFLFVMP